MTRIAAAILLISPIHVAAQSPHPLTPPVDVQLYQDHIELISPVEVIRAADDPEPPGLTPLQHAMQSRNRIFNNMVAVEFDVIVNENGVVESAKPIRGPQRFYEQAQAIEMRKRFDPISKNGAIVRAHFTDAVRVLPPERWNPTSTQFPATPYPKTVSITLTRTRCYGACPAYQVTLTGAGDITFTSDDRYNVAVPGVHHAHASAGTIRTLLAQFRNANFLSALDEYRCGWTDMPTQKITLDLNGIHKTVVDYGGDLVGLPDTIAALEPAIDKAAETDRWVKGNADTKASLQAEHWNFASPSQDNIRLFDVTIRRKDSALVQLFLAARAPVITSDPQLLSPICAATGAGNLALVEQMLSKQPRDSKLSPDLLDECLPAAASSGNLSLVELWVGHGARPVWHKHDGTLFEKFRPPLLCAIDSRNPDVLALLLHDHPDLSAGANDGLPLIAYVLDHGHSGNDSTPDQQMISLLINAGANVNESTQDHAPAIFHVTFAPQTIPLLLAAGANVNSRWRGDTPLMRNCFVKATVQSLLAAGADPMLKNQHGETAFDQAKRFGCKECANLLDQAMKSRITAQ